MCQSATQLVGRSPRRSGEDVNEFHKERSRG